MESTAHARHVDMFVRVQFRLSLAYSCITRPDGVRAPSPCSTWFHSSSSARVRLTITALLAARHREKEGKRNAHTRRAKSISN